MTLAVTVLIVVATLGLAALLSSPFAEKHPACETAMFIMIYAALASIAIGAILAVIGMTAGLL